MQNIRHSSENKNSMASIDKCPWGLVSVSSGGIISEGMGERAACPLHRFAEDCSKPTRFVEGWHCLLSHCERQRKVASFSPLCTPTIPSQKGPTAVSQQMEMEWGSSSHVAEAKQNLSWPERKAETVAS